MPLVTALLLAADTIGVSETIVLGIHLRADGANLLVGLVLVGLVLGVVICSQHWMYVQPRRGWLSAQFSKSQDKLLLEIIGEAVLFAEEDHATLRD